MGDTNLSHLDDRALLRLMEQKDDKAFREIYHRYAGLLYAIAFKRLSSKQKAEDLLQDIFMNFYRSVQAKTVIENLQAWLVTCMRNRILNEIRDTIRRERLIHQLDQEPEIINEKNLYDLNYLEKKFHLVLASLSKRAGQVFRLSRIHNLANKEIANELDISVKTVEKHMTHALRVFEDRLG